MSRAGALLQIGAGLSQTTHALASILRSLLAGLPSGT